VEDHLVPVEEPNPDEVTRLREALNHVLFHSLLCIRRAAFAPEIGCRYTEAVRFDIEREVRRLEDYVRRTLDPARTLR